MFKVLEAEMALPDGRTLSYVEWGDSAGPAVVLCHPATRVVQPGWEVAEALGIRIIFPERPGIGRSTFQTDRSILDWPADVAALMAHLGIDSLSVVGVSACTPYALACGVMLDENVDKLGIMAGTVPLGDRPDGLAALARTDREEALAEARGQAQSIVDDIPASVRRLGERPGPDGPLYRQPEVQAALLMGTRETYRQGTEGPAYDTLLRVSPWGFNLGDLARPCLWWHGEEDAVVRPTLVEQAVAGLSDHHLRVVPGVGHGICMTHVEPFLDDLTTGHWKGAASI